MKIRTGLVALVLAVSIVSAGQARAQDVPGIEICTAEKDMARRTGCLQSNIDFLKTTMTRMALDHQRKLDATNRQIEALKASIAGLQKTVDELQAAQKKLQPGKEDGKAEAKDGVK